MLWHALEHIVNPVETLMTLKNKLKNGGYLLVQVPDIRRNPFDLAVIDHYSHFTRRKLTQFFNHIGFEVVSDGYEWTDNCLTLLLKKATAIKFETTKFSGKEDIDPAVYYRWVNKMLENFKRSVENMDYAIFGTGIASLWIYSQLPKKPLFFVDEDNRRAGNLIDGVSIVTPEETGSLASNILMPFVCSTGLKISQKLRNKYPNMTSCNFILTSEFCGDVK